MHWTDKVCGHFKILDKICLCRIFNFSSVDALRHSKLSVNHKCQSHGNKHHLCSLFAGKVLRSHGLRVIFNRFDRICCLGILLLVFWFFFFLEFVQLYYASGGFTLFDYNVPVLGIILAGFGSKYSN